MIRDNHDQHPDLDTLIAYSENRLDELESASLATHLKSCATCRLELMQFQRFCSLDSDPSAEINSGWDLAKLELEKSWNEKTSQSEAPGDGQKVPPLSLVRPRRFSRGIWVVPAAAALAALIFFNPASGPGPVVPETEIAVVRGAGEPAKPGIALIEPEGRIDKVPKNFAWNTEIQCDHFALEVFTADLETVIMGEEISASPWTLNAKEQARIELGTTYFWKVRGYRNLQAVAESGNQWFTVQVHAAAGDSLHQGP